MTPATTTLSHVTLSSRTHTTRHSDITHLSSHVQCAQTTDRERPQTEVRRAVPVRCPTSSTVHRAASNQHHTVSTPQRHKQTKHKGLVCTQTRSTHTHIHCFVGECLSVAHLGATRAQRHATGRKLSILAEPRAQHVPTGFGKCRCLSQRREYGQRVGAAALWPRRIRKRERRRDEACTHRA